MYTPTLPKKSFLHKAGLLSMRKNTYDYKKNFFHQRQIKSTYRHLLIGQKKDISNFMQNEGKRNRFSFISKLANAT